MKWMERLAESIETEINCKTFAAFNANIDVIVKVKASDIKQIFANEPSVLQNAPKDSTSVTPITKPAEFLALLKECISAGKSYYDVVDIALADWFEQSFSEKKEAMGGQAGIIANQMAALGADSYVYNPVLSSRQAEIYNEKVKFPVVNGELKWLPIREAVNDTWTKVNFIFEYPEGETYQFDDEAITSPRANRVILGTRNAKAAMGFDEKIEKHLDQLGENLDVGFMAGYHHGKIVGRAETLDEFIELSLKQKEALCSRNPDLKLHVEYVPMKTVGDEKKLLEAIVPTFDSFGINENEIRKVLEEFGHEEIADDIADNERAFNLYKGSLALLKTLKIPRIQLHNLGYYIVVLEKPYFIAPEKVRQACLFASAINGVKAKQGGAVPKEDVQQMKDYPLSDVGFEQLKLFAEEARQKGLPITSDFEDTGIMEEKDHYLLLIPAHVVPNPVSTVGMGDTVSSSSFAAEVSLSQE